MNATNNTSPILSKFCCCLTTTISCPLLQHLLTTLLTKNTTRAIAAFNALQVVLLTVCVQTCRHAGGERQCLGI